MFDRHSRAIIALAIVALLPARASTAESQANHIVVVREVLLEAAHPNTIVGAPGGGYVIAGYSDYSAWAAKVDESGKVVWRHEFAGSTASPAAGGTEYRGITFLRDGTVLLCGSVDVSTPTPESRMLKFSAEYLGLLIRLNARGEMIGKDALQAPQLIKNADHRGLNYFDQCAATETGVIAVGRGVRRGGASTAPMASHFSWLVWLDRSGDVVSNKVFSPFPPEQTRVPIRTLVALHQRDFLMIDVEHSAVRFTKDGEIEQIEEVDLPIVPRSGLEEPIHTIPEVDTSDPGMTYRNLDKTPAAKGASAEFQRSAAYALPDGSLALFGSTLDYGGTAAVEWLNVDGTRHDTYVFFPTHGAAQIDAVAPTPRADEFATVRLIIPGLRHKVGPDETRSGVLLTFLRFQ
jgi:hypothetical protein